MKRVAVLLSTYNGSEFIQEQMNSLVSQVADLKIDIIIRDDGSIDNTNDLLNPYSSKSIRVLPSKNVGVIVSFLNLLLIEGGYDYYFLCDQDDYWLPNKIQQAVNCLELSNFCLYHSDLDVVDSKLNFVRKTSSNPIISLGSTFLLGQATGCTMCIRPDLRKLILEVRDCFSASNIVMHDSFIYKIAQFTGFVYYDNYSGILYRQHSNNVLGVKKSNVWANPINTYKSSIKSIQKHYKESFLIRQSLIALGYDINKELDLFLTMIDKQSNFKSRLLYILANKIETGSRVMDFMVNSYIVIKGLSHD